MAYCVLSICTNLLCKYTFSSLSTSQSAQPGPQQTRHLEGSGPSTPTVHVFKLEPDGGRAEDGEMDRPMDTSSSPMDDEPVEDAPGTTVEHIAMKIQQAVTTVATQAASRAAKETVTEEEFIAWHATTMV